MIAVFLWGVGFGVALGAVLGGGAVIVGGWWLIHFLTGKALGSI